MHPRGFITVGDCRIDASARICPGAVIGKPCRPLLGIPQSETNEATIIGPEVYVGYYSVIGAGSVLERGVVLDDFSVIECGARLGEETLVIYRGQVCNDARVGRGCVIGGLVAERVVVGDRSRVFGKVVHLQHDPSIPWDAPEAEEGSAIIEEDVFIGFDALVVGQVRIGKGAYVCAGSIITRDVPLRRVAYGTNQIIPYQDWKGRLRTSSFFTSPRPDDPSPGERNRKDANS